jgi:hypothetical protein
MIQKRTHMATTFPMLRVHSKSKEFTRSLWLCISPIYIYIYILNERHETVHVSINKEESEAVPKRHRRKGT